MDGDLLRELTPEVIGALVRRYGHFDAAEDAVQEALLAAVQQWPSDGVPDDPRAWLIRVASRKLTDVLRSEEARRRREDADHALSTVDAAPVGSDDTLVLLFLCCHPALSTSSQIALTLRAVGGLRTDEIASAFLVPEATMGQRISRAKGRIRSAGARFVMPASGELDERIAAVLHVLYLIFNEGYTASSGSDLSRADLCVEAIRLARLMLRLLPDDGEVGGLLALMLLTDARRQARVGSDGELVPLEHQDRSRWDTVTMSEGIDVLARALAPLHPSVATLSTSDTSTSDIGPYRLQAAIAAVHDAAPDWQHTDWRRIDALYGMLESLADNPMVTLNRAVAVAMVRGPQVALALIDGVADDERLRGNHRLAAVRGHLYEMSGDVDAAVGQYVLAADGTSSLPERRYLETKAAALRAARGA